MQWCEDESYVRDLLRRRYDPHVAPINCFVDKLRRVHPERFIPYVAATFGAQMPVCSRCFKIRAQ